MGEDLEERVAQVKTALSLAGIRMSVGGCSCCGSPWVKFEMNGQMIVDGVDDFNFDMFDEENA